MKQELDRQARPQAPATTAKPAPAFGRTALTTATALAGLTIGEANAQQVIPQPGHEFNGKLQLTEVGRTPEGGQTLHFIYPTHLASNHTGLNTVGLFGTPDLNEKMRLISVLAPDSCELTIYNSWPDGGFFKVAYVGPNGEEKKDELTITRGAAGAAYEVHVSVADSKGRILQQTSDLKNPNWTTAPGGGNIVGDQTFTYVTAPGESLYFRTVTKL